MPASVADVPHELLLIRHGEIGLKSFGVKARLERMLTNHLEDGLIRDGVEGVVSHAPGRHYVEAHDLDAAAGVVRRTFGITSYSPATRVPGDMESIAEAAARYAEAYWPAGAKSFAVRPRRTGEHTFTSQEVGKQAGSAVFVAMQARGVPVKVDLSKPDFALHIEVRHRDAYLYHEKHAGPGGLPLGSQGRLAVFLDSGDAVAAAYLMMRRGAQVYPYFIPQIAGTRPYVGDEGDHPAHALHALLRRWGAPERLITWNLRAERITDVVGDPLPDDGVPLARIGLEAGGHVAKRVRAQAIVTGETVRAPWAARLPETQVDMQVPVLRPLMGLTRAMIDDFREVVGLERLAGPRPAGAARAYTAGGRTDTTVDDDKGEKPQEVGAWDPW